MYVNFFGNHWWCEYCNCPCDDGGYVDGKWACIACIDRMEEEEKEREQNRNRLIAKFGRKEDENNG